MSYEGMLARVQDAIRDEELQQPTLQLIDAMSASIVASGIKLTGDPDADDKKLIPYLINAGFRATEVRQHLDAALKVVTVTLALIKEGA